MNPIDLAWAAGFFDGEGSIFIQNKGKGITSLRITTSQVNPLPIAKFFELFGGHTSYQTPKNKNWNPQWKWEQDSRSASETLEKLLPYLIVKKEVALLALEFQAQKRKGRKLTQSDRELEALFKSRITFLNKQD